VENCFRHGSLSFPCKEAQNYTYEYGVNSSRQQAVESS